MVAKVPLNCAVLNMLVRRRKLPDRESFTAAEVNAAASAYLIEQAERE